MSKPPVSIVISADQIRAQETDSVLRLLVAVTASAESIVDHRKRINLRVGLPSSDTDVAKFFTGLNRLWPLWTYFLADPESLDFVATAICGSNPIAKKTFIADGEKAVSMWMSTYDLA
ncbi:MAG: hypothetical protein OEL20_04565 [Sulfuritalea sp.]|nr:hypothetical protein [Sulfuritalea sp.]